MDLVTSDQIFKSWRILREEIADDIQNVRKIYRSNLCMSKSLTSTNFFTQKECCSGCNTLKTFMTALFLENHREIKVMTGTKRGTTLRVFSRDNIDTRVVDGGISLNPFMNYVVVSCVLKHIVRLKSYPVNIPYEWSYVCRDKFNIVLDTTNVNSLKDVSRLKHLTNSSPLARKTVYNPISKATTMTIFRQIVLLCHFYGMYRFSHGEPSITYISFHPASVKFTYNGKQIDSSVKVSITPSVYSGIVYKETKFAYRRHTHKYNTTYENRDVSIKPLGDGYTGNYEDHRVVYVKIGNKSEQFLKNLINGDCGLKAFDFVMFMGSIMVNKQYMTSFKDCPYIDIWKNMWRGEDYEKIASGLAAIHTNSFKQVFDVVKNCYFRVDAMEYAMSAI